MSGPSYIEDADEYLPKAIDYYFVTSEADSFELSSTEGSPAARTDDCANVPAALSEIKESEAETDPLSKAGKGHINTSPDASADMKICSETNQLSITSVVAGSSETLVALEDLAKSCHKHVGTVSKEATSPRSRLSSCDSSSTIAAVDETELKGKKSPGSPVVLESPKKRLSPLRKSWNVLYSKISLIKSHSCEVQMVAGAVDRRRSSPAKAKLDGSPKEASSPAKKTRSPLSFFSRMRARSVDAPQADGKTCT